MSGRIAHIVSRLGWIGLTALLAATYFLLGTIVSLLGGDIGVALGSLVITLLSLAIALWRY